MHVNDTEPAHGIRDEFRENWPLLLAAAMGVGLTSVHTYSIGIFIGAISHDFGWRTETVLLGLGIVSVMTGICSPICGHVMDRVGARPLGLLGTVVIALGTAAIGLVPKSLAAFLGCYIVVGVGTILASPMVWQRNIVERFVKGRGLAVSVALCGSNFAGAVAPILATLVVGTLNWRWAYIALGGYMLLSTFPLAWFFLREPAPRPSASKAVEATPARGKDPVGMSLAQAFRAREFWLIIIAFLAAGVGIAGFIVHLVPMLTSRGFFLISAASAVSMLSIAAICGRLAAGALMDNMLASRLAAIALLLPVVGGWAILTATPGYAVVCLVAVSVGLSTGAEFNMISYLAVQYFGLKNFGVISGIIFGVFMIGCLGGQLLPPLLVRPGNYNNVIILFMAAFSVAAILLLFCRPYSVTRSSFQPAPV